MADKKLSMDLLTTYRKDYVQKFTRRPPLHQDEKEYPDILSGPYTEYILPAYKWDQHPVPNAIHEHPDDYFKRMWESKEVMPTYTGENEECYCVKMLNKRPQMDPPDKNTVACYYNNRNKTAYQIELCHPNDKYVPLKKSLRKVSDPLPNNWEIPLTSQQSSYRPLDISKKYIDISPSKPFKPVDTRELDEKMREIMKIKTGQSEYEGVIDELGSMILREQMYGEIKRREIANAFKMMRQQQKLK